MSKARNSRPVFLGARGIAKVIDAQVLSWSEEMIGILARTAVVVFCRRGPRARKANGTAGEWRARAAFAQVRERAKWRCLRDSARASTEPAAAGVHVPDRAPRTRLVDRQRPVAVRAA